MATSITHDDVKPRVGIPSATTDFDTEIDKICTAMGAAVDAYVASAYLTSDAAVVKEAAILISSGTVILSMAKRPGWGEAVTAGGLALGSLGVDGGSDMIKLGWELLKPFTDAGHAEELAKQAEAVRQKLLSDARSDDAGAQADAELLKLQNEAAKLGSEKLKIDSEELKTDAETALLTAQQLKTEAETATEAKKPMKVLADAAMSTAYAADAQGRADIASARLARMRAEDAAIADATELPLEDHSYVDNRFSLDSQEYDL